MILTIYNSALTPKVHSSGPQFTPFYMSIQPVFRVFVFTLNVMFFNFQLVTFPSTLPDAVNHDSTQAVLCCTSLSFETSVNVQVLVM